MFFVSFPIKRATLVAFAICLAGCGGGHAPPPATAPDAARQALTKALDAWKAGTEMQSLAAGDSAVYVGDEDWSRGSRLTKYTLVDDGQPFGSNVRFVVDLELTSSTGTASNKRVRYIVGTNPVQSVQRDDDDMEEGVDA